jgi:hypothetical protein
MSTTIAVDSTNTPIQNSSVAPNINQSDAKTTSVNLLLPTMAHLSPNPSPFPTNSSSESLPSYNNVSIDMPPSYPTDKPVTSKLDTFDAPYDWLPIEPQKPWPISKTLYIFGYLIWPLWYIGVPFSFFGKNDETKRWGRRCILNAVIITGVFGYLVFAYRNSVAKN